MVCTTPYRRRPCPKLSLWFHSAVHTMVRFFQSPCSFYHILFDRDRVLPVNLNSDESPWCSALCNALGFKSTLGLWRRFFRLVRCGDWFTIEKRPKVGDADVECFSSAPTCLKNWKDKFVWVDVSVAPIPIVWRTSATGGIPDPMHMLSEVEINQVKLLCDNKVALRTYSEEVLVLGGLRNIGNLLT